MSRLPARAPDFDLLLVTDRAQSRGGDLLRALEQALAAGIPAVQLREKDLGGRELYLLAERAKRLCERYGARLYINDRIDVALAVAADGVQLGSASLPIAAARALLGERRLIGASVHSTMEAAEAARAGADFVLFGPVFFTPSKAAYGKPQGVPALKEVVEKIALPVYAIGGIKRDNAAEVKAAGARGIAIISAILGAADPAAAAREILRVLRG